MELIAKLVDTQLSNFFPVVLVIIVATLVYTFGFKSPEQPQFDKLSSIDDRKSAGKKRKIKDKKTANGFAVSLSESKSEKLKDKELKRSPTKNTPETPKKAKKQEPNNTKQVEAKKPEVKAKKPENLEDIKNKKNKAKFEKPVDYDEGDWETVPNKSDKKKKLDSPIKKEKKGKIQDKAVDKDKEIQKLVKGEIEKHLQDSNKENKSNEGNKKAAPKPEARKEVKEIIPVIEEAKPKKEKKPKEKVVEEVIAVPDVVENSVKVELEKVAAKIQDVKVEPVATEVKQPSGEAVFDELGDIWTEAKAVKKSKKKSRRD